MRTVGIATAILLVAAFLRLYRLSELPPGFYLDEGFEALNSFRFAAYGIFPQFEFPVPPPVLFEISQAAVMKLAGATMFVARLHAALWGLIAVACVFQAGRAVMNHTPYKDFAGFASAGVLAVMLNHIATSRIALDAPLLTAFEAAFAACVLFAWKRNDRKLFALAGVLGGLTTIETYFPGLALPVVVVAFIALQTLLNFGEVKARAANLTIMVAAMALIVVPIFAAKEIATPGPLYERMSQVAEPAIDGNSNLLDMTARAAKGWWLAAQQIYLRGDPNPRNNVANAPLLSIPLFVLFLVGIGLCVWTVRKPGSGLLLSLFVIMLFPAALSSMPIESRRASGELIALAVLAGLGLTAIAMALNRLAGRLGSPLGRAALIVLVGWQGIVSWDAYSQYFTDPSNYDLSSYYNFVTWFRLRPLQLAEYVNTLDTPSYLSLDYFNQPTNRFALSRRYTRIHSFVDLMSGGSLSVPDGLLLGAGSPVEQYVLLVPPASGNCCGDVYILPPLSASEASALSNRLYTEGEIAYEMSGLETPYQLYLAGSENPFTRLSVPQLDQSFAFGSSMELVGWSAPRSLAPGEPVNVTLFWRATAQKPYSQYQTYVHLIDRESAALTAGDQQALISTAFSALEWDEGDIIPDVHRVEVPSDLSPGVYGLLVGAYPHITRPLTVTDSSGSIIGDSIPLWVVKVPLPEQSLPRDLTSTDAVLDGRVRLDGYVLTQGGKPAAFDDLRADDPFTLTLYWEALSRMSESYHLFVHFLGPDGAIVTSYDGVPLDGVYPTFIWDAGEIVPTVHTLTLNGAPGSLSVRVGLYTWPDIARLPVLQNGQPVQDSVVVLWP